MKISLSYLALCATVTVALMLLCDTRMVEAVTCNAVELSPCLGAFTSGSPPSPVCCTKLRQQKPCLCGYLKDPNLKQYVSNPKARKVAATCGVPYPKC